MTTKNRFIERDTKNNPTFYKQIQNAFNELERNRMSTNIKKVNSKRKYKKTYAKNRN